MGNLSSVWSAIIIATSISTTIPVHTVIFPTAQYVPVLITGGLIVLFFIIREIMKKDIVKRYC